MISVYMLNCWVFSDPSEVLTTIRLIHQRDPFAIVCLSELQEPLAEIIREGVGLECVSVLASSHTVQRNGSSFLVREQLGIFWDPRYILYVEDSKRVVMLSSVRMANDEFENRLYLECRLLSEGQQVCFGVTHLTVPLKQFFLRSFFCKELQVLLQAVEESSQRYPRFITGGDLNNISRALVNRRLSRLLKRVPFNKSTCVFPMRWKGNSWLEPFAIKLGLDHLYYQGLFLKDKKVIDEAISDHKSIYASFEFE